jgi:hypothetical protein
VKDCRTLIDFNSVGVVKIRDIVYATLYILVDSRYHSLVSCTVSIEDDSRFPEHLVPVYKHTLHTPEYDNTN